MIKSNVIIHIPHSSVNIPEEVMDQFSLTSSDLDQEILRLTDHYTDELFDLPGASRLVYPFSRLVADPERFRDDSMEPMSSRGMGAVYTKTTDGSPMRCRDAESQREYNLEHYYDPHHAALTALVEDALTQNGGCLIIDAHSFPSSPLPCDMNQSPDRPEICIGTDSFHTSPEFAEQALEIFKSAGWNTQLNNPYEGAIVPNKFYKKSREIKSIMIEVNRRLYMDETTGAKLPGFCEFKDRFKHYLIQLCERYAQFDPGK